jgi:hypothetical protein
VYVRIEEHGRKIRGKRGKLVERRKKKVQLRGMNISYSIMK